MQCMGVMHGNYQQPTVFYTEAVNSCPPGSGGDLQRDALVFHVSDSERDAKHF